jgi:hypothetical protein
MNIKLMVVDYQNLILELTSIDGELVLPLVRQVGFVVKTSDGQVGSSHYQVVKQMHM